MGASRGAGPSRPSGRSSPAAPLEVSLGCRAGWAGSADSPGSEPRRRAAAPSVSSAAVGERAPGAAERGATGDGGGGGDTGRARARRILLARQLARCPAQGRNAARLGTGPAGRLDGSGAGGECRASEWGDGGGRWRMEGTGSLFLPEKRGGCWGERSRGPSLGSAPYAPACGRPAHLFLRPSPAPGTHAPAGAEGSGEASGPRGPRQSRWARVEEEAFLGSDPDSLLPRGRGPGEARDLLMGDGAVGAERTRGENRKRRSPCILSPALSLYSVPSS